MCDTHHFKMLIIYASRFDLNLLLIKFVSVCVCVRANRKKFVYVLMSHFDIEYRAR